MSNESYLKEITDELARIPVNIATQVASEIFEECVQKTRVDSGQAAANWRFAPYERAPAMEGQTMMWGYGNIDPSSPVGYKWAQYDNSEAVYLFQFEQLVNAVASMPDSIDGIMVYNPIDTGFPEFAPGTDIRYPDNAFRSVNVDAIVNAALARAYSGYSAIYGNANA